MANPNSIQLMLNRLNWKVNTGETKQILEVQLDVYKFIFKTPLEGEDMIEFTSFMQDLDMSKIRSVMLMWVWLYQHEVDFKIRFGYNPRLSLKYNLKNRKAPKELDRRLRANGHDDIMECRLDQIKQ